MEADNSRAAHLLAPDQSRTPPDLGMGRQQTAPEQTDKDAVIANQRGRADIRPGGIQVSASVVSASLGVIIRDQRRHWPNGCKPVLRFLSAKLNGR